MPDHDELEQQLWELIYGLAPEAEAAALVERITSDPAAARAYAEARLRADLLADAAKLHAPRIALARPADDAGDLRPQAAADASAAGRSRWRRLASWSVALAACALVAFLGISSLGPASPLRDEVAQAHLTRLRSEHAKSNFRVQVSVPPTFSPAAQNSLAINTSNLAGEPISTDVQVEYSSQDTGEVLQSQTVRTDALGKALVPVQGDKLAPVGKIASRLANAAEKASVEAVVTAAREEYLTRLSCDKPVYQPGEEVNFRSLTLSRFSLQAAENVAVDYQIERPGGGSLDDSRQRSQTVRGVAANSFTLPPDAPGGRYEIVAQSADQRFPEARQEFFVSAVRNRLYHADMELNQDSYLPGQTVVADLVATRSDGLPAAGVPVEVQTFIDGKPQSESPQRTQTAPDGTLKIKAPLPEDARGVAALAVSLGEGAARQTEVKEARISTRRPQIDFYPEGGDLAFGLSQRVYFHAHDGAGQPAHFEGRLVDDRGRAVAEARTTHQGRGVFEMTYQPGRRYFLQAGAGEAIRVEMPAADDKTWLAIRAAPGVFAAGEPLSLRLASRRDSEALAVVASCRGAQVGHELTAIRAGQVLPVALELPPEAAGVIRVTAYDTSCQPPLALAERLVYRRPAQRLNVEIAGASSAYAPGETAKLSVLVTDEQNNPASAVLGIAAVDRHVLAAAPRQPPRNDTFFFLTSQIQTPKDLENVNFYLDEDASAASALDLALGTQGWRRFAEIDELDELAARPPGGVRGLADGISTKESEFVDEALSRQDAAPLIEPIEASEPPILLDNRGQLQSDLERKLAAYYRSRQASVRALGAWSIGGAALLLAMLVVSAALGAGLRRQVWAPAAVAALGALAFGFVLAGARVDSRGELALLPAAPSGSEASRSLARQGGVSSAEATSSEASTTAAAPASERADSYEAQDLSLPAPADSLGSEGEGRSVEAALRRKDAAQTEAFDEARGLPLTGPGFAVESQSVAESLALPDAARRESTAFRFGQEQEALAAQDRGASDAKATSPSAELARSEPARPSRRMAPAPTAALPEGAPAPAAPAPPGEPAPAAQTLAAGAEGPRARTARLEEAESVFQRQDAAPAETPALAPPRDARQAGQLGAAPGAGGFGGGGLAAEADYGALPTGGRGDRQAAPVRSRMQQARSYAFNAQAQRRPPQEPPSSTLYWNAALPVNADGEAAFEAPLPQTPRSYGVLVEAHGGGRLGAAAAELSMRLPVRLAAPIPPQVTAGDRLEIPLLAFNGTGDPLQASLQAAYDPPLALDGSAQRSMDLPARQSRQEVFAFEVGRGARTAGVWFGLRAGEHFDQLQGRLTIGPPGYPWSRVVAAKLGAEPAERVVDLPADLEEGSIEASVIAFPSFLSELRFVAQSQSPSVFGAPAEEAALAYPWLLAMRQMAVEEVADPEFIRQVKGRLAEARRALAAPQAERSAAGDALALIFLAELRDLALAEEPAIAALAARLERGLAESDTAPAARRLSDAWAAWALAASGRSLDADAWQQMIRDARMSSDPRVVALAANAALALGNASADELIERLSDWQRNDGSLDRGALASAAAEDAEPRRIEAAALAMIAWSRAGRASDLDAAERAARWLAEHRQSDGGLGDPLVTALALQGRFDLHARRPRPPARGTAAVSAGGRDLGQVDVSPNHRVARAPLDASALSAGEHRLRLVWSGEGDADCLVAIRGRTPAPPPAPTAQAELSVSLDRGEFSLSDPVTLSVEARGEARPSAGRAAAVVGLPAGMRPPLDQLEERKQSGAIEDYRLGPQEVTLIWPAAESGRPWQRSVQFTVAAEAAGRHTAPPSRLVLEAQPAQPLWIAPLRIVVQP